MPEAQVSKKIAIRCYGFQTSSGKWQGVCLNFNLAAEADTIDQLKNKMDDIISSYIESVLETTDKASIDELLTRKAPLKDWFYYYLIKSIKFIGEIPSRITFQKMTEVPS